MFGTRISVGFCRLSIAGPRKKPVSRPTFTRPWTPCSIRRATKRPTTSAFARTPQKLVLPRDCRISAPVNIVRPYYIDHENSGLIYLLLSFKDVIQVFGFRIMRALQVCTGYLFIYYFFCWSDFSRRLAEEGRNCVILHRNLVFQNEIFIDLLLLFLWGCCRAFSIMKRVWMQES